MPAARHAIATAPANDVAFTRDEFTRMEIIDVGSDFNNLADELVPDHHRHRNRALCPVVPVVDMNVGAADAGSQNAN